MAAPDSKSDTAKAANMPENATDVVRVSSNEETQVIDVDTAYLTSSRLTKFFRSVLFQMIMFGALSFVGPAMQDAISNLG